MMLGAYVLNVQQNHLNKVSRAKTQRRKERYLSISPNLGVFARITVFSEILLIPKFSNIFG